LTKYNVIKVGRPFSIEELRRSRATVRKVNPRDAEIERLVNEVSAGPESSVWPWELGGAKLATARAAANRVIKRLNAKVAVGVHRDHPNTLLFSRSAISKRGRRKST
jgi:hypothetical protein